MVGAERGHVLVFDNLSSIRAWLSDSLCRLATGGGLATRELYSDREEVVFEAVRPVVLTGIEDLATSADLLDRTVILTLASIDDDKRREEAEFWDAFEKAKPRLLGAILDVVVLAKKALPDTKLKRLPRMADFGRWGAAVGLALGWPGAAFSAAYARNRGEAHGLTLEASPAGAALCRFMEARQAWDGTAAGLLKALADVIGEAASKDKAWPENPRALSGALRRATPALKEAGIVVDRERAQGRGRARIIRVRKVGETPSFASEPSASLENPSFPGGRYEVTVDRLRPQPSDGNGLNCRVSDGTDGTDAKKPDLRTLTLPGPAAALAVAEAAAYRASRGAHRAPAGWREPGHPPNPATEADGQAVFPWGTASNPPPDEGNEDEEPHEEVTL